MQTYSSIRCGDYSALSCPGNPKEVQSTQVSHNRETQHTARTATNMRPLSASHWSGVSRDSVFTTTPTTQVCRLRLLTLVSHHRSSAAPPSPVGWGGGGASKMRGPCWLQAVAFRGCSSSGRGGGGEGGITGKSLQVRHLLDLMNFGVCVLNKNFATGSLRSRCPWVV